MDSGGTPEETAAGVAARFRGAVAAAETGDVLHLHDFDGAAYAGDVGELAADHPESGKLGFADREEFDRKVAALRDSGAVSRGAEFAAILERDATVGLAEVARVVNEAQEPARLREGFGALADALEGDLLVVTAGPTGAHAGHPLGAERVLAAAGHAVPVVGSELEDDPAGGVRVRRYCGREQKVSRVEARDGPLAGRPVAAVGDSATDTEVLAVADQSWALGEGALAAATLDAIGDAAYRGVAVSSLLVDALYAPGSVRERAERARTRARAVATDGRKLPRLAPGPRADRVTEAVLALYAGVRN